MIVLAPISIGELYDKITILRIKADRFGDAAKLENVRRELGELEAIEARTMSQIEGIDRDRVDGLVDELRSINSELWDIEDGKRASEARRDFGPAFVQLARDVYTKNDVRAALKREINELTGSTIVEEKSHGR